MFMQHPTQLNKSKNHKRDNHEKLISVLLLGAFLTSCAINDVCPKYGSSCEQKNINTWTAE